MQPTVVLNFMFCRNREENEAVKATRAIALEGGCIVLSKEEKVYQQLIAEKLKAAAEWDFRDARQLTIG